MSQRHWPPILHEAARAGLTIQQVAAAHGAATNCVRVACKRHGIALKCDGMRLYSARRARFYEEHIKAAVAAGENSSRLALRLGRALETVQNWSRRLDLPMRRACDDRCLNRAAGLRAGGAR